MGSEAPLQICANGAYSHSRSSYSPGASCIRRICLITVNHRERQLVVVYLELVILYLVLCRNAYISQDESFHFSLTTAHFSLHFSLTCSACAVLCRVPHCVCFLSLCSLRKARSTAGSSAYANVPGRQRHPGELLSAPSGVEAPFSRPELRKEHNANDHGRSIRSVQAARERRHHRPR